MKRWLAVAALITLGWFGVQTSAQRRPDVDDAVRTVPVTRAAGENPGQKGATYYALEGRTRQLTTEYSDGTRAIAERGTDGDVTAHLEGPDRNELNRVRVDRMDGTDDVLEFELPLTASVALLVRPDVHPTLDWASRQSHQFHVDQATGAEDLQWKDGLARRRGGAREAHELQAVRSITTKWTDGLSAVTTPVHAKQGDQFRGRAVLGDVLVTKVMKDGVQVGIANYLTHEQVFTWQIGTSGGSIATEHLAPRYGGWLFTPDMVWMNLQSIAMYEWKNAIDREQFVARAAAPVSPLQRLQQFFAPSISANEPGCDGLHWLDGSVFRYCCDMHDRCYSKYGCTAQSWWQVWTSWTCDICNGAAIFCFGSGPAGPFYQYPW